MTVFGCAIQSYRSPAVIQTLAAAGFYHVFIDLEHGGFDVETVQDMVEAALAGGITPLARAGEPLYSLIARFLGVDALSMVWSRVEESCLLREALRWMKFPAEGSRGFGVLPPLVDLAQEPMPVIMEHLHRNTTLLVQL